MITIKGGLANAFSNFPMGLTLRTVGPKEAYKKIEPVELEVKEVEFLL